MAKTYILTEKGAEAFRRLPRFPGDAQAKAGDIYTRQVSDSLKRQYARQGFIEEKKEATE